MAAKPQLGPRSFAVGIVGAGVMGAGIAQVAAVAGHTVLLYDAQPEAAAAAIVHIRAGLDSLARKEKLPYDTARSAAQHLSPALSLKDMRNCGLIIEAIVEDLEAKRILFRELEAIVAPDALLATNTSSLSITAIGAALRHPGGLAGMHFFNPAPLMPLVEIVRGSETDPALISTLQGVARRWGKTPVVACSTPGFIVNRAARPFYSEGLRVLQEGGADCATIDAVLREAGGFRMGPFELMDLIGNDVNYAVTLAVFEAFYGDSRFTPSPLQWELVQAGRLGRKCGRGFYSYQGGRPIAIPSTAAPCAAPRRIRIYGDGQVSRALADRLAASGVKFEHACTHSDRRVCSWEEGVLYCTDGRTATACSAATGIRNTLVMDMAFDPRKARRVALAAADHASSSAKESAIGLLQMAGFAVSILDDLPGMIVLRTMAMLANVAADAIQQGVCSIADLDLAMRLGVNYPCGPLEWVDGLGAEFVVQALDHMAHAYGDDRYRPSILLRRKALTQARFTGHRDRETAKNPALNQPIREHA